MKVYGPPRRGISSPQFSTIRGAILTDHKIEKYIALGFYGDERRSALLAKKTAPKREKKQSVLQQALQNLGL